MFSRSAGTMRAGDIRPRILLSFDVEEFDIPLEYGQDLPIEEQLRIGGDGLAIVLDLLERLGIAATLFTTARFARGHERLVAASAERHEIASHGMRHGHFHDDDLRTSKETLEAIAGVAVRGFRRPRFEPTSATAIRKAGYAYNSSENPIWLPGRYNYLARPRTAYIAHELVNIPLSATPFCRFPLFWLSFKNAPIAVIRAASALCLRADSYLNLVFHPWEFVDLGPYRLPYLVKRISGEALLGRLERYLTWLRARGEFVTCWEFARDLDRSTIGMHTQVGPPLAPPPRGGEMEIRSTSPPLGGGK